jgi:ribosomal protein L30/L7E
MKNVDIQFNPEVMKVLRLRKMFDAIMREQNKKD